MLLHCGQGLEHFAQVVGGIEAELAAGFDEAVDDGAGLPGVGAAEETHIFVLFPVALHVNSAGAK